MAVVLRERAGTGGVVAAVVEAIEGFNTVYACDRAGGAPRSAGRIALGEQGLNADPLTGVTAAADAAIQSR